MKTPCPFEETRRSRACGFVAWIALSFCGIASAEPSSSTVSAYFYVEPYEARFECLVRLDEMFALLGGPSPAVLSQQEQTVFKEKVRAHVRDWLQVKLDGETAAMQTIEVSFVKGEPGRTESVAKDAALVVSEGMIGLVWGVSLPSVPKNIELEWRGFEGRIRELHVTSMAGQSSNNFNLEAQYPKYTWHNEGRVNLRQPLAEVPSLPGPFRIPLPLGSIVVLVVGVFTLRAIHYDGHSEPGRKFVNWGILVAAAALLWRIGVVQMPVPFTQNNTITQGNAENILRNLLRNTYRAFEQYEESAVYDVLARSIQGDLLQKIYLQTAQALTLDAQDGTRVKVTDLSVTVDNVQRLHGREGFVAEGQWTALGTVGHWGHAHNRVNRYRAKITVEPFDGAWKISGLDITEEKRM